MVVEKITPGTWDDVWKEKQDRWDYLSEVIYDTIVTEIPDLKGKNVLEAGSGSGRISKKIAAIPCQIFLLDYSSNAFQMSRRVFQAAALCHQGVQGDIFHLPFHEKSMDVVWNAGVIEHYYEDEQARFFQGIERVLKPGGFYITLNPYKKSILHTWGKRFIEKVGKYPYGLEMPIESIQGPLAQTKMTLKKKEYSIGFIMLFVGMFKRLRLLPGGRIFRPIELILNRLCVCLHRSFLKPLLVASDRCLSKIFGGYLLVSIVKK